MIIATARRRPSLHRTLSPVLLLAFLFTPLLRPPAAADPAPASADQAYSLAIGRYGMDLYKEARESFALFIKAHPGDPRIPEAHFLSGECLVAEKQYAPALEAFRLSTAGDAKFSRRAEALFRTGEMTQLTGKPEESLAAFTQFLTLYPDHALAATAREKQAQALIDHLYRLLSADPGKARTEAALLVPRTDAAGEEALYLVTILSFNQEDYAASLTAAEALSARFPASPRLEASCLTAANAALKLKQPEKALALLQEVKTLRQDEVLYLKGTLFKDQGKVPEAQAAFTALTQDHKESSYHAYGLFELGALTKDHQPWKLLFERYASHELAAEAACRWASELLNTGQEEEIIALLKIVPANSPRRTDADRLLISITAKKDPLKAAASLEALEAAKVPPAELTALRYTVGLALLEKKDPAGAALQFLKILEGDKASELYPDALYRLGLAREEQGDRAQALASFERLIKEFDQSPLVPFSLLRLASLYQKESGEKKLQAAPCLKRILTDFAHFPHRAQAQALLEELHYQQAWALHKDKAFLEAAPLFSALRTHATYGAEASYLAGVDFHQAGRLAEAEEALTFCLKNHPNYTFAPDGSRLLGEIFAAQQKWQAAADHYTLMREKAEEKEHGTIDLKLGMALYQLNQLQRAVASLNSAVARGTPYEQARATFFLGEIAFQQKRYAEARDHFLNVSILFQNVELTPASLLEAAKCFGELGEKEKRDKLLQKLLENHKDSPHARSAEAMLKQK